ncbi:hypothetical protein HG535_0E01430 [Zygotorulaspora mrakii]|uniref:Uncharacterized protein n=1 Tax=Zygotorulaspora mrakii TaxID=42260 RepID=A0A7H9B510_ZYGMR|nr:uncharacterized protein HG535_0E01430 [Zygotorulaspora mrakii]QLG73059.1 hypothetical protein HG535_0E01430 [Zygotorulaspora mrakii]
MEDDEAVEDLLEVYIKSLEEQVETKKYFLKQAKEAINTLEKSSRSRKIISDEEWQRFLKKPMYFPERSDPIGLSLASVGLRTRRDTSFEWIKYMENHLKAMEEIIQYQKNANHDITVLTALLEQGIDKSKQGSFDAEVYPTTPKMENQQLLLQTEQFIRTYLSVDMVNAEDVGTDIYDEVMALIKRLINYDKTLKVTDFHHGSRSLYRLLLRSNLIEVESDEKGEKHIKLLDFRKSDLL